MTDPTADLSPPEPADQDWIEIHCAFPLRDVPQIPWNELASTIQRWRESDMLREFFFTRKPPGVRLRLRPSSGSRDLELAALDWSSEMRRRGKLIRFTRSVYEPEEARFGGPTSMQIAHDLWSADSLSVLEYECLSDSRRGSVPRVALWARATNDLLQQTLDDWAEIWDVWCRLAEATAQFNVNTDDLVVRYSAMAPRLFAPRNAWAAVLPPEVRSILYRTDHAQRRAAEYLRELASSGQMKRGLRSWLTASALFQANRWGLGMQATDFRAVTLAMVRFLEPDGTSRPVLVPNSENPISRDS